MPFDHPLCVLFSSGTTGLPKAIIHGHGGILLEHLKNHVLGWDLGPGDRLMWFSTTAWMMWNALVSTLLTGASIVMLDGNPLHPDAAEQWRLAADVGATVLGVSPAYLAACRKAGVDPGAVDGLRLRELCTAGAPLPPDAATWIYDALGDDILLMNGSGGTDVCSGIVQGNPLLPVWAGAISGRCLGVATAAFDPDGRPVVGELGELVITEPMPSMPVGFWNDPDGARYRATYFDHFPGVWRQGDWVRFFDNGSCVVTGRSDATLNRGGVRLGTGEFYRVVEEFDEVLNSLVVHLEDPARRCRRVDPLRRPRRPAVGRRRVSGEIARRLRSELSPRHVPDAIVSVDAIPIGLTGKKLELPVKRILQGANVDDVASRGALVNPSSLDAFVELRRQAPIDDHRRQSLVAIDMHVHVEQDSRGCRSLDQELLDASARYFKSTADRSPTVERLAEHYRSLSMAAVIFTVDATSALGHPALSSFEIADAAAEHADVLIPFGSVDPHQVDQAVERVRRLVADHGVRGFKFHPTLQAFTPNDDRCYPIYAAIEEAGVPVVFHTGQTGIGAGLPGGRGLKLRYSQPMLIDDVAADFPDLTIILAHPSVPWQDEAISMATHKSNVFIDLSGWSPKYFPPQLVRAAGSYLVAQGAVRLGLSGDRSATVDGRLHGARAQRRGPRQDRQGQRRRRARPRSLGSAPVTRGPGTAIHGVEPDVGGLDDHRPGLRHVGDVDEIVEVSRETGHPAPIAVRPAARFVGSRHDVRPDHVAAVAKCCHRCCGRGVGTPHAAAAGVEGDVGGHDVGDDGSRDNGVGDDAVGVLDRPPTGAPSSRSRSLRPGSGRAPRRR